MSIIYRLQKGAPLSAQDLDGNFHEIEMRLNKLEDIKSSIPHYKITIVGNVLTIHDDKDQIITESVIPVLRFIPKGDWKPHTNYIFNDIVCKGTQIWCALKTHVSQEKFEDNQSQWMLFCDLTPGPLKS